MSKAEAKIREELRELEKRKAEADAAVVHILQLLETADERRKTEDERRWNRLLDHLENALDLTRSRVTMYVQEIRSRERQLDELRQTGVTPPSASSLAGSDLEEGILSGAQLPTAHIQAAEQILAMSLEDLGNLTLEEVAALTERLHEGASAGFEPGAPEPESGQSPPRKETALAARIEHAKQKRQALAAQHRAPPPSFQERRRQKLLRDAITNVKSGDMGSMTLEEIELVMNCHKAVAEREHPSESDVRLKDMLAPALGALDERAHDLRRQRAKRYARKKP